MTKIHNKYLINSIMEYAGNNVRYCDTCSNINHVHWPFIIGVS